MPTRAFASLFDRVAPYFCTQPCYFGGPFALNWASDEDDHLDIGEKKLAKRQEKRAIATRYWTPAVHNAAFALPRYEHRGRRVFGQPGQVTGVASQLGGDAVIGVPAHGERQDHDARAQHPGQLRRIGRA